MSPQRGLRANRGQHLFRQPLIIAHEGANQLDVLAGRLGHSTREILDLRGTVVRGDSPPSKRAVPPQAHLRDRRLIFRAPAGYRTSRSPCSGNGGEGLRSLLIRNRRQFGHFQSKELGCRIVAAARSTVVRDPTSSVPAGYGHWPASLPWYHDTRLKTMPI